MEKILIIDISEKDNSKVYKEILKFDSSHNHPEKEYDVSLSLMKHKIKDGIEKKEYNDDIFVDELDSFYTTSFAILQNKEQEIYKIFKKLKKKKNANTYKLNELEHLPYYDYQRKIRGI
ncbi:hypothetical protein H8356DRAFT_1273679 [Neocallimastix lanati (nom. inval.)]|nr:hypothetical protein H8356DRAFT_1273679 [Neocallimastix sp. JGI-2020a]